jgi:hypothetical protein
LNIKTSFVIKKKLFSYLKIHFIFLFYFTLLELRTLSSKQLLQIEEYIEHVLQTELQVEQVKLLLKKNPS